MNILKKYKRIHMIGIKGTGMSALAVNLKQMGMRVTGSDYTESFFTDELLKKQGLKALSPFSANNIPDDTDLVIVSTAYNSKNPEVQEAERRGLSVMTYPQVLGLLTKQLPSVAVCGSHGKTTTSGILAYILSKTKYSPMVNVGSIVPQLVGYKAKNPKLFIFEADEYQNKFRYFFPKIVILTNIDYDHPDYFHSPAHYESVFRKFIARIPLSGLLIYCADDKNCRDVARFAKCKKNSYGFSKYADCRMSVSKVSPTKTTFSAHLGVELLSLFKTYKPGFFTLPQLRSSTPKLRSSTSQWKFRSKLIGNHNALNLAAAALCAAALGVPFGQIKKAIANFAGTKRRLEITRQLRINGHDCIVIDDFGHHPTEIKATVATIKAAYPKHTLWTVFQPHTFSRTEALFNDFAKCFDKSDKTIVLDIYASKREESGPPKFSYGKLKRVNKIHSRDLVKKIGRNAYYQPDIQKVAAFLKKKINADSIILTIGASEIWRLANLL